MVVVLAWSAVGNPVAAQSPVHYLQSGAAPPGAIGSQQLLRGGPLPGYFQPVEIRGPAGTLIATATAGGFDEPQAGPAALGLLIGSVYRLRVASIPDQPGVEVYPTIEVIDRTYPPRGQEFRFPIPIELTAEELEMASLGQFVTRVVYLEDPEAAAPVARAADEQSYFEVADGEDPLEVADGLGRPVAILRMGARVPDAEGPDDAFLYGSPPLLRWQSCPTAQVSISDASYISDAPQPSSSPPGRRNPLARAQYLGGGPQSAP